MSCLSHEIIWSRLVFLVWIEASTMGLCSRSLWAKLCKRRLNGHTTRQPVAFWSTLIGVMTLTIVSWLVSWWKWLCFLCQWVDQQCMMEHGVQMTIESFLARRIWKVLSTVYSWAMKCTHEKNFACWAHTDVVYCLHSSSPTWRSPSRVTDISLKIHDECQSCHPTHQWEVDDNHELCQDSLGCTFAQGLPRLSECASWDCWRCCCCRCDCDLDCCKKRWDVGMWGLMTSSLVKAALFA